ncbi:molybdate transport system substrate-binding protein [Gammaproteobacteria bacterium]
MNHKKIHNKDINIYNNFMFKKPLRGLLFFLTITFFHANIIAQEKSGHIAKQNEELLISAAISLKDIAQEFGEEFEKNNINTKIFFNFASSGQLRAQIENGASVDIFISASTKDMDYLDEKKLIVEKDRKIFAKNKLVLIANNQNKDIYSLSDLKNSSVKKIAIGNPDNVPAGKYAEEALAYFKILSGIKEKLVFAENVRQVLNYVSKNEVDAGVVFYTDTKIDKNVKIIFTFPLETCKPIIYPIAPVKSSKNIAIAKKFIEFVISAQGKKKLKSYGFIN